MNKFFYILILLCLIVNYMLRIERFKMLNASLPITNANHKLNPAYDIQTEIQDYYDLIQKQKKQKEQKEQESYEKDRPSMVYYENRYQYRTPEKYFDTEPNLGCDDKMGICMSNCLPQQSYPNTPKMEIIITNGSPVNMVEKIFPKFEYKEEI